MKKLGKTTFLIFISFFIITSCGKKGALQEPENMKRPKFDNVIAE